MHGLLMPVTCFGILKHLKRKQKSIIHTLSNSNMKVYILFQTDVHKTKSSRVCFGVFSTQEKAITVAKENDLYSYQSEVVIIECDIDKFEEL